MAAEQWPPLPPYPIRCQHCADVLWYVDRPTLPQEQRWYLCGDCALWEAWQHVAFVHE